ncbi:expressed protein, partial [Phakopsora pachyrhizi]
TSLPIESFCNSTFKVVSSSLPFWRGKKNVTITYKAVEGEKPEVLHDLVEYHSGLSVDSTDPRKQIIGIDRPVSSSLGRIQWKWRGQGLLMLLTSNWELLGYNIRSSSLHETPFQSPEWVITYFAKTLFTPAGIDIYGRSGSPFPDDLKRELIDAIRRIPSRSISILADSMFDIPHD